MDTSPVLELIAKRDEARAKVARLSAEIIRELAPLANGSLRQLTGLSLIAEAPPAILPTTGKPRKPRAFRRVPGALKARVKRLVNKHTLAEVATMTDLSVSTVANISRA